MTYRRQQARRATAVVLASLMAALFLIGAKPAAAQTVTDPYGGGGVTVVVQIRPGMKINVIVTTPGEKVRVSACIAPNRIVNISLNPGTTQNPGRPCPRPGGGNGNGNALGVPAKMQLIGLASLKPQDALLQATTATTTAPLPVCAFNRPTEAGPPSTTTGGVIATEPTDSNGCLDTFVTVPNRPPGYYEVCAAAAGAETVCTVLRIVSKSSRASEAGRGFARTGLDFLPWVLGALAAIIAGRTMLRRSRRSVRS